jgi:putative hydrolase of the HAD superfamily
VTVRAVFFDAGETLVHPHPSFPELFAVVLRREGHDVDESVLRDGLHVVSDRFADAARAGVLWTTSPEKSKAFWLSVYDTFLSRVGVAPADGLPERLYAEFTDLANYRLFPDVEPALRRLAAHGLTLGVISNFEAWLEGLLESLGVSALFAVRVISGVEGVEKPDPAIFRLAMSRAGVTPAESAYVGDIPGFDTEPATRLGMLGVLIDRRGRFPDHAGARIATMGELPAALGLEG